MFNKAGADCSSDEDGAKSSAASAAGTSVSATQKLDIRIKDQQEVRCMCCRASQLPVLPASLRLSESIVTLTHPYCTIIIIAGVIRAQPLRAPRRCGRQ